MAFSLIRPASRIFLDDGQRDAVPVGESDRIAALLRDDYQRWSRWGVGIGAFVAAVLGAFTTGGMIDAILAFGGAPHSIDLAITALAAVIAVTGGFVLVRLWLTGRALATGTERWLRVPYTAEIRARHAGGWLRARTANFDPPIFARLVSATLALLLAVAGVALFVRDIVDGQFSAMSATSAVIGLIGFASGIGQAGGVVRIVSGVSESDPLWYRVRSLITRR